MADTLKERQFEHKLHACRKRVEQDHIEENAESKITSKLPLPYNLSLPFHDFKYQLRDEMDDVDALCRTEVLEPVGQSFHAVLV